MNLKSTLYVVLLLICTLIAGAHADIKYTQTMTMGDDPDAAPMMRTSHFVAPGKERNDTEMDMGNYHSKEAVITICQPEQTIHIDDALKIYAIEDGSASAANTPPATEKHQDSREESGTGKIAVNVKVTDLQPEKIAGWDTKHYMVEMHIQNSGCVGNGSSDMKMELWVADVKDAHACKNISVDYDAILGQHEGGKCKITYETTGDTARFAEVWNGLVMRRKTYDNEGRVTTIQEITSLSQAKLDDSVFAIPDGYTKLSMEEYNKQRQQAMMKAAMGGANNNAADDNQDDGDQGNDKNNDQDKKEKKKKHHGFHLPGGLPF